MTRYRERLLKTLNIQNENEKNFKNAVKNLKTTGQGEPIIDKITGKTVGVMVNLKKKPKDQT